MYFSALYLRTQKEQQYDMLLSRKRLCSFSHPFSAYPIKLEFMIQNMETGRFLNMMFQIIEKIRVKRDHLAASSANEMVVIVLRFPLKKMSELIAHASVVKTDPVHKLHVPQQLQRSVNCSQSDLRIAVPASSPVPSAFSSPAVSISIVNIR